MDGFADLPDMKFWREAPASSLLLEYQSADIRLKRGFIRRMMAGDSGLDAWFGEAHSYWKAVYDTLLLQGRLENPEPLKLFYQQSLFSRDRFQVLCSSLQKPCVTPRVSVVMAVYHGLDFIMDAISSVLLQTYDDLELIIVNEADDESGPAEAPIMKTIVENFQDPRIRLIQCKGRLRFCNSLNKGISEARGEFIARLDADDYAFPTRLRDQVDYMDAHPEIALHGGATYLTGSVYRPTTALENPERIRAAVCFYYAFHHTTVMFRKDAFERRGLRYNPFCRAGEDHELWLRAFGQGLKMTNSQHCLCYYRNHESNGFLLLKKHPDFSTMDTLLDEIIRYLSPLKPRLDRESAKLFNFYFEKFRVPECRENLNAFKGIISQLIESNRDIGLFDPGEWESECGFRVREAWRDVLWYEQTLVPALNYIRAGTKPLLAYGAGRNADCVFKTLQDSGCKLLFADFDLEAAGLLPAESAVTKAELPALTGRIAVLYTPFSGRRAFFDKLKATGMTDGDFVNWFNEDLPVTER